MTTENNKNSFKKLPIQIEWVLPCMFVFLTYITYHKTGVVLGVCILTFFIMINGWISSKATSDVYSDMLLTVDVLALCVYLCMLLSLHYSQNEIDSKYWLCSSLLCGCYGIWDIMIKKLVDYAIWKKTYFQYVIYMTICFFLFMLLYIVSLYNIYNLHNTVPYFGIVMWVIVLSKWHYDKLTSDGSK